LRKPKRYGSGRKRTQQVESGSSKFSPAKENFLPPGLSSAVTPLQAQAPKCRRFSGRDVMRGRGLQQASRQLMLGSASAGGFSPAG